MSISPAIKSVTDGASIINIIAVFISILPDITAFFSLVWILIRLYETKTVQKLLNKNNKTSTPDEGD